MTFVLIFSINIRLVLIPVHFIIHVEYDCNVAVVRAELDEEAFAAAWAEGRKTSMEEALEYALDADG